MRTGLYLLILFALAMVWLVHQLRGTMFRLMTGHAGDRLLDFRIFGYDKAEVSAYFQRLGPDRRKLYGGKHLWLELAFIVGYGVAAAGLGFWFSSVLTNAGWKLPAWVPLIGGVLVALAATADIDEGQRIGKLLRNYPKITDQDVKRAAAATRLKWMLLVPGVMAILAGLLLAGYALLKG
jgi:hypothetical protein